MLSLHMCMLNVCGLVHLGLSDGVAPALATHTMGGSKDTQRVAQIKSIFESLFCWLVFTVVLLWLLSPTYA